MKTTIRHACALAAMVLCSGFLAGCEFSNTRTPLAPTAPSSLLAAASGSSTASSSAASAASSAAPSAPAAAGVWASPAINGLPNLSTCGDLQWQISSQSSTAVTGTVSTVCGGIVNLTANISGEMSSTDVVQLSANGQAVGLGLTCVFSLNGTGYIQGSNAMLLNYQGMTCLGTVSGSETLQRREPAPPPPPEPPPPAPEPPQAPPPDDGAFGCSGIGDRFKLVECIHDHVRPRDEYQAFEVTKRVAWALRGEGAGLLIKTTGENIVPWRGYIFSAGRIAYPDGHIYKVISDVGPGGANAPSWQDNDFVDRSLYLPALDTTY